MFPLSQLECRLFIIISAILSLICPAENAGPHCAEPDLQALLHFKAGIVDDTSGRLRSWNGSNCCQWQGVTCNRQTGRVMGLLLPGLLSGTDFISDTQMKGTLSESLGDLQFLEILEMGALKQITGSIPLSFGRLRRLKKLRLNANKLGGSIPPFLAYLHNLQELDLSENGLRGTLPVSFGGLRNLRVLNLYTNRLAGPVPESIDRLSKLTILDLHGNLLRGPIPRSVGELRSLQSLDMSDNRLTGTIPYSIGMLSNLSILYLNNNNLSGNIPHSIGKVTTLGFLRLQENKLRGILPASFGGLVNLQRLSVANNMIGGPIPASWAPLVSGQRLQKYVYDKISNEIPEGPYYLVYIHTSVQRSENRPSVSTLWLICEEFPPAFKEMLHVVYFLHPWFQSRLFFATLGRFFLSAGLYWKLKYVNRLEFIWDYIRKRQIEIPDFVYNHDDQLEGRPLMDYGVET